MANTINITNRSVVQAWEKRLATEIYKGLTFADLIGYDAGKAIQRKDSMFGAGASITYGLRPSLMGTGSIGSAAIEGKAETTQYLYDTLLINQLRHAVQSKNTETIDQQALPNDLVEDAHNGLLDWWDNRLTTMFFSQACGYNGDTLTILGRPPVANSPEYQGMNPIYPPSEGRAFAQNQTSEEALTENDKFSLMSIVDIVTKARMANPALRPIRGLEDGADYILYIHDYQARDLKQDTGSGEWFDWQKYADMSRRDSNKAFSTGKIGVYNRCEVRVNQFVSNGVDSKGVRLPNVRRAVLLGAQGMSIAFGARFKDDWFKLVPELHDGQTVVLWYGNTIFGLKKTRFSRVQSINNMQTDPYATDYGIITYSTFAGETGSSGVKPIAPSTQQIQQKNLQTAASLQEALNKASRDSAEKAEQIKQLTQQLNLLRQSNTAGNIPNNASRHK